MYQTNSITGIKVITLRDQASGLVHNPSESKSVEIKRWIDPSDPKNEAKKVKGLLALRNFNGGFMLIGFDDKTLRPDSENVPKSAVANYHADAIQALVSKYSSETFEVEVLFPERDGQVYPVISVPSGVKIPVIAKRDLLNSGGGKLVAVGDVYFRTLRTNNTVSTAKIAVHDWPELIGICFDNREADIGRFLRRQLGGVDLSGILELLGDADSRSEHASPAMELEELLNQGQA